MTDWEGREKGSPQSQPVLASNGQPQAGGSAVWLAELAKLAGYDSVEALIADTGPECWQEFIDDGYTPGEAWAEECSYD